MSNLANQLVVAEREEVARGIRALLAHPLLTERRDPVAFELVRRRREPLARWFDYTLGWSLVVESRQGYARLTKVRAYGTGEAGDRPARRPRSGRAPLDRLRYVLLCVTCAELLSVPVTTVGLLADRVVRAMAADDALPAFDTTHRATRMAFVDVLRLLESYGALTTLDGATDSFTDSADAKVLYRVQPGVLLRLPAAPVGPSRIAADESITPDAVSGAFDDLLAALVAERRYGTEAQEAPSAQRNLWLRHSVLRRLFDDPVVHRDDLTEAQLSYLASLTGRQVMRRAAEQAGFVLEERADGWLLADPEAVATDEKFPDDSSHAKIAALLMLDTITGAADGCTPVQLAAEAAGLLCRFPAWGKAYRSDDGAARLADDAVRVLAAFGLVRLVGSRITARPAAARYRVTGTVQQDTGAERNPR
ncbi:TIGR02678 family protein [Streptomyces mirabilis]|uniref:TIGR02678 family protein n=1 Tax=Streptomyces mirabilis TaxID=68239 RepID=UPI0021C0933B|nr:TIGR02678 family protein [Streptomyces mirabilis]MCT9110988.1 TIGR02678 family protein [Streptomyces mirabilis]